MPQPQQEKNEPTRIMAKIWERISDPDERERAKIKRKREEDVKDKETDLSI